MNYDKFLDLAQKYKADQARNEVKFLELLVEQEGDVLNWKAPRTPYKSWSELLREEGLCTFTTYRNYKRARQLIPEQWISKLGVYASISISKLDEAQRRTILEQVKKWYGHHKVTPTYQRVSKYVRDLGGSRRKTARSSKVQLMRAYIVKCQGLLKKNKIEVPPETWGNLTS
jgi:hypothetical protein